jgi:hypothetical protein
MNHQQVEVFELLRGFSTEHEQFHQWYYGAINILDSKSAERFAQAAHSIRELCDRLPRVIAGIPAFKSPISTAKQFGPELLKIKQKSYAGGWIGQIINPPLDEMLLRFETLFTEPPRAKRFGRALIAADPQADSVSGDWRKERDKALERLVSFFQIVAHHNRSVTEIEFEEKLELFESLLLNYFTPCTAAQQKELLALATAPADSGAFDRVTVLVSHKAANFCFFLDNLEHPSWLSLLNERGYFGKLPGPEHTEDGRILYRPHLPLMALKRLAGAAPQIVTGILRTLRLPDNPCVGDQVLQCMAKLGDASCIKQLQPLIRQLSETSARASWFSIEALLESWIELKVLPEIFAIVRGYLNKAVDFSRDDRSGGNDAWLIKQVDQKCLTQIMVQYPLDITVLTFEALCKWVDQERRKYAANDITDDTPSSYWLEDFKIAPPNYLGLEGTLALRLYSAAELIYREGRPDRIDELDDLLRSNSWQLFQRVRWQLYADFPTLSLHRARSAVLERIPFLNQIDHNRGCHDYEFAQLLIVHLKQHGTAFLSLQEVEEFASVVLKGPIDEDGKPVDCKEAFCRKQLWPISAVLHGEQLAAYRVLVPDDSTISIESYKPFHSDGGLGGEIVSVAPSEADNLGAMDKEQLWLFLNTWQPKASYPSSARWVQEDIFALASKFAELVEEVPERFKPESRWWEQINRAEILNKLLERAADRVANNQNSDQAPAHVPSDDEWANWLGILIWVMGQGWPCDAATKFIQNVLEPKSAMPDSYAAVLPDLLRSLIVAEDSRLAGGSNSFRDWLSTAINSTRGRAFEGLLNLALRQYNFDQHIAPWIFELIRSRLELQEESPAVFALLGAKLRFLVHLFGQKLKEFPNLLFPSTRPEHRSAAIIAHFTYDRPWIAIIETFPRFIDISLDTLESFCRANKDNDADQNGRDFGSRLGTHIAFYYWNGAFANDLEGEVALDRFFAVAPKSTCATFISHIGAIWEKQIAEAHLEKALRRVMRIWERRFAQIERDLQRGSALSSEYDGELAESTDWLSCECLPFEWRFTHAKLAVERLKKAPPGYRLLKAISEFGALPERLGPMLELLLALLKKPTDELRWSIRFKELAPVISLGLASIKPTTRNLAAQCKDMLLRMGCSEFLDLDKN